MAFDLPDRVIIFGFVAVVGFTDYFGLETVFFSGSHIFTLRVGTIAAFYLIRMFSKEPLELIDESAGFLGLFTIL